MRLDRVELFQAIRVRVEVFDFLELEVFHKSWVQILKLSGGCELLRQQEVLEGYRKRGFCMQPSVRHYFDKVLGRHRLIQGYSERDPVLIADRLLLQNELLIVQDLL